MDVAAATTDQPDPAPRKPAWRKVVDFPLVAMVILTALLIFGIMAVIEPLKAAKPILGDVLLSVLWGLLLAICAVAIYKVTIRHIGERRTDELPFDRSARDFPLGVAVAFVLMTGIVGVTAALGGYRLLGWGDSGSAGFLIFMAGIGAGFYEEILIRGVVFRFLEEFGGTWFALALSSAIFGLGHMSNPNATVFTSLAIAIGGGLMLGGAYIYTRSLWLPIGIHMGWNVTQGYVWDVPVSGNQVDGLVEAQPTGDVLISGGAFGLEASIVALIATTIVSAWLVVRAAQRGHLMRPWWVRRRLAREGAPVDV